MKLLHKYFIVFSISLSVLALSFATASAKTFVYKAVPKISVTTSLPGSSSSSASSTGDTDNHGELDKSGSSGSNTSDGSSKVWWDISSDGHADESPTSPEAFGVGGDGSGIFLNLRAKSSFKLKAKFKGSTKTLININSEASRIRTDGFRKVKSKATVLGATVYNKNYYNYDGETEALTSSFDKSKTFFSKTIPVWWFLKVKVAVGGSVGVDPNLRADNNRARADMEPFGGVTGTGEVIINLGVVKGGAGGKVTLAEIGTPIDAEMRIDDTDGYDTRICYTMKAKTTLEALSGTLYVWGKYWLPFKGWSKKYTKNVFTWNGLEWNLKTLYNKNSCQWI